ncbi:MAG: nicotinate-nucleotide adenylyltransferase [Fimbriimonadales bacterium]|nr:nicotinate-nucleotide adenylyltransferase [Fimbriimonadales bacterium]
MRLGIFGGTFDPIHIAHLRLGIEAAEVLHLDRVVFEVAKLSPLKGSCFASDQDRLRMAELATEGEPKLSVGSTEISRPTPSYAVETIEHYQNPGVEIWFLMGADSLLSLDKWKEPDRLLNLCRLGVAERPGYPLDFARIEGRWHSRVDTFPMRQLDISSTEVRDRVAAGRSIRGLVADSVRHFIEERRLYR